MLNFHVRFSKFQFKLHFAVLLTVLLKPTFQSFRYPLLHKTPNASLNFIHPHLSNFSCLSQNHHSFVFLYLNLSILHYNYIIVHLYCIPNLTLSTPILSISHFLSSVALHSSSLSFVTSSGLSPTQKLLYYDLGQFIRTI